MERSSEVLFDSKLCEVEKKLAATQLQKECLFLQTALHKSTDQRHTRELEETLEWYKQRLEETGKGLELSAKNEAELDLALSQIQQEMEPKQRPMPYGPEAPEIKENAQHVKPAPFTIPYGPCPRDMRVIPEKVSPSGQLKKEFPKASMEQINSALTRNNGNLEAARAELLVVFPKAEKS